MEEDGVPDWVLSGLGSENSGNLAALGGEPTTEPDVPKQSFVQAGQFGESGGAETNATLALILSLVGLLMCGPVTAIPALIIAQRALAVTPKIPGHPDHDPAVASLASWQYPPSAYNFAYLALRACICIFAVATLPPRVKG